MGKTTAFLANIADAVQAIQAGHTDTETAPSNVPRNWPKVPGSGGTVYQKSLTKSNLLLSLAARKLLCFCYKLFRKRCPRRSKSKCAEIDVAQEVTFARILNNKSRAHTFCFKIPDSIQCYTALTPYAFKEFSCESMKNVIYCFILLSRSFNDPFVPFHLDYSLETIYESDDVHGSLRDTQPSAIPEFTNNQNISSWRLILDSYDGDQSD